MNELTHSVRYLKVLSGVQHSSLLIQNVGAKVKSFMTLALAGRLAGNVEPEELRAVAA